MARKKSIEAVQETAEALAGFLGTLTLGEAQAHENMTVFPVFTTNAQKNGYSLLDEAVKTGKFTVTEVSEGGSVPNLKVVNGLDLDVLILDGDILVGAKQNRSVTTTIIIGKGSENIINVNCVEQGRWSRKGDRFSASEQPMYSSLRAVKARSVTKSLKEDRDFTADQGAVWENIEQRDAKFRLASASYCSSVTGAADEMYRSFDDKILAYEKALPAKEGQVGFLVVIAGKVAGCDIFGNPGVLSRVYKRGIRSYCLDAIERSYDKAKASVGDPRRKASAFLAGLRKLSPKVFPAMGKGVNVRFESRTSVGFAALNGDQVVHMAAFQS